MWLFFILFLAPPGDIHALRVNYVTKFATSLSWRVLQCHISFSKNEEYIIVYTPVFDDENGKKNITVSSVPAEITGLLPRTEYKFFVLNSKSGGIILSNVQKASTSPPLRKCVFVGM